MSTQVETLREIWGFYYEQQGKKQSLSVKGAEFILNGVNIDLTRPESKELLVECVLITFEKEDVDPWFRPHFCHGVLKNKLKFMSENSDFFD